MRYAIVIEKTTTGFYAYAPGLPGCITTFSPDALFNQATLAGLDVRVKVGKVA